MKHRALLVLILIVATALRLYRLGEIPVSLYIDEASIGVEARSIAERGLDMHGNPPLSAIFPAYGDYKLPVYIWLAAGSVKLFGPTEFAVRFPSALAGIVSVLLVYGISRLLPFSGRSKPWISLAIAGGYTLMPWSVHFSRAGFEGHVGQMFVLLAILTSLIARTRPRWYLVVAIAAACAVYSYFSTQFVLPIILLAVIALFPSKWVVRRGIWMGLSVVLAVVLLLPLYTSEHYGSMTRLRYSATNVLSDTTTILESNELRSYDNFSFLSRLFYHRHVITGKTMLDHVLAHVTPTYLFLNGDHNLRHGTGKTGVMLLGMLPFFVVGIYALIRRYRKVGLFVLVWWFASVIPAAVPAEVPHALRSLNGVGAMAVIIGIGVYELLYWSRKTIPRKVLVCVLLCLGVAQALLIAHDYLKVYPSRSADAWARTRTELAKAIQQERDEADTIYVSGIDRAFLWILFFTDFSQDEWVHTVYNTSFEVTAIGNVRFVESLPELPERDGSPIMMFGKLEQLSSNAVPLSFMDGDKELYGYEKNY